MKPSGSGTQDFYLVMTKYWPSTKYPYRWARGSAFLLGLFVVTATACTDTDGSREDDLPDTERIVARVNGKAISVQRFNTSYVDFLIQSGMNDTPRNRYAHLDNMIDAYLIAEEAKARGFGEQEGYRAYMKRQRKKTVGGKFFQERFVDTLSDVTEAEARRAFKRNKEKIVARHLLYPTRDQAQRAYERLQDGESFIKLANECFSTTEFDSLAGYLGVAGYWELDDAFAEAAWKLPPHTYSEPVRTRYGWHIILVENKITRPLLTESEFQYSKKGMTSKARIRKYNVEGSDFVRSYMEQLNVVVNPDAIRTLQEAIHRLAISADVDPGRRSSFETDEVKLIQEALTPETVLASYFMDGKRHDFTALEYYTWLEDLPFNEARHRTAASVGRALRNEVFARKGMAEGLEEDPLVQDELLYRSSLYLSSRLRDHIREHETVEPTPKQAREAFKRFGLRKLEDARADFWAIRFDEVDQARAAKKAIETGTARPDTFNHYQQFVGGDLLDLDELGHHIRKAPLDMTLLLGTKSHWYVVYVTKRDLAYTRFEDVEEDLHQRLRTQLPLINLIKRLRAKGEVDVDRELFEKIMKLE